MRNFKTINFAINNHSDNTVNSYNQCLQFNIYTPYAQILYLDC